MFEDYYESTNVVYNISEFNSVKIIENNQIFLVKGNQKE